MLKKHFQKGNTVTNSFEWLFIAILKYYQVLAPSNITNNICWKDEAGFTVYCIKEEHHGNRFLVATKDRRTKLGYILRFLRAVQGRSFNEWCLVRIEKESWYNNLKIDRHSEDVNFEVRVSESLGNNCNLILSSEESVGVSGSA